VGTYQPNAGSSACLRADPGTYVAATGATVSMPCPIGTHQPDSGSVGCRTPEVGFIAPETGLAAAIACPEGFTSGPDFLECVEIKDRGVFFVTLAVFLFVVLSVAMAVTSRSDPGWDDAPWHR
jgi:hypothetical protein